MTSMGNRIPLKNAEGYADPTAYAAMNAVQKQQDEVDQRVQSFVRAIKTIIDQSGYDPLARIEIRDRMSGREYR